jgi:hypothetical protein
MMITTRLPNQSALLAQTKFLLTTPKPRKDADAQLNSNMINIKDVYVPALLATTESKPMILWLRKDADAQLNSGMMKNSDVLKNPKKYINISHILEAMAIMVTNPGNPDGEQHPDLSESLFWYKFDNYS